MTRQHLSTAPAVLGVLLLAGSASAGQASMLDSSEASAFMGTWGISMKLPISTVSPRVTFEQTVTIRDEGGKVAARLEHSRGSTIDITDITKDGDTLILNIEAIGRQLVVNSSGRPRVVISVDRSGRGGPAVLTLALDGALLHATQQIGAGQLLSGTGEKRQ